VFLFRNEKKGHLPSIKDSLDHQRSAATVYKSNLQETVQQVNSRALLIRPTISFLRKQ